jgi:hypothetical protein
MLKGKRKKTNTYELAGAFERTADSVDICAQLSRNEGKKEKDFHTENFGPNVKTKLLTSCLR